MWGNGVINISSIERKIKSKWDRESKNHVNRKKYLDEMKHLMTKLGEKERIDA